MSYYRDQINIMSYALYFPFFSPASYRVKLWEKMVESGKLKDIVLSVIHEDIFQKSGRSRSRGGWFYEISHKYDI